MKVNITVQDLRQISRNAKTEFINNKQPNELDSAEYMSLCYLKAVDILLNTKGVQVDTNFTKIEQYETVD